MSITLIACLDINSGIGTDNGELLFHLPKDLKHFKDTTREKVVVMGRNTWDSLPIKPLPNRENYVLTRDISFKQDGVNVVSTIDEVVKMSESQEVFVIGGGEVYEQFIDIADKMILTQVHAVNPHATVHFPDFTVEQWKFLNKKKHEVDKENHVSFTIAEYEKRK